jgi:hypothetical protein
MTSKSSISYLDEHRRLRFHAFSSKEFEDFFLRFFNSGISLAIEREGRKVESKVITAELYNTGTGRDQNGIDLKLRVEGGETWAVQCKRHKTWSVRQTETAVADAVTRFPAQHYFLMVACDPAEGVQDYMATQPKWSFWNHDQICAEFRLRVPQAQQPRVLSFLHPEELRRFAPYSSDALVSADDFFAPRRDLGRAFHHQHKLVGRADEMRRLRIFATARKSKALLLSGPGGVGKSRLLRELARLPGKHARWPEIVFLNPHATAENQEAAVTHALWDADKPRLIIVDDAHRPETLPPKLLTALLARIRECPGAKLLITTRPSAIEVLRGRLRDHGIIDENEPLTLAPLAKKDLRVLAIEALGKKRAAHANDLVNLAGTSAFLVALAGDLLRREQLHWHQLGSDAEFRAAVFRCYEEENLVDLAEGVRDAAKRLLRLVALVAPFTRNEVFCRRAAQSLGLTPFVVESLAFRFQAAGLLTSGERELRVVPDLFGDFLVFQTAFDAGKRAPVFVQSVLAEFTDDAGSILRNAAEAVWLAPDQAVGRDELIAPLVAEEMRRFDTASFFDRGRTLQRWAHFGVYLPAETVALARHALEQVRAAETAGADSEGIQSPRFLCSCIPDLLRPVVLWNDEHRASALDLLWILGPRPHFRHNDNNHPWGIIADAISYGPNKSPQASDDTLTWLERLVQRPSARPILEQHRSLLATFLGPLFAREMKWSEWEGRTCHVLHRRLSPEFVRPWRERSLALLRGLLEGDSLRLALAALAVLDAAVSRIAGGMTDADKDLPHLHDIWRPERLRALELLPFAMERHPQPVMRHAVRRVLEPDLAYEKDPDFKAAAQAVLRNVPDDLDLRLGTALMPRHGELEISYHLGITWSQESAPEIRRRWEEIVSQTTSEWLSTFPVTRDAISHLAKISTEFETHGYQTSFHTLFSVIGQTQPSAAARLIDALFAGSGTDAMKQTWPVLALSLNETEAVLLERARHHPEGVIARGVIDYLERQTLQTGALTANGRALLEDLAANALDTDTARALVWLVITLPAAEVEWGFKFLSTLPLAHIAENGRANLLLDALHPIRAQETSPPAELVRAVLAALVPLPDFGNDHLTYELSLLKPKYPRACYDFFVARLRHAATLPQGTSYTPLPHELGKRFSLPGVEEESDFTQICTELFAQALNEIRHDHRSDWTSLFQGVAIGYPEQWMTKLQSEITSAENLEVLMSLTDLIRYDGSLIVFQHPALTRSFLAKAEDLEGAEGRKKMESRLYGISGPQVRGYSNGSLEAKYDYMEAAALGAATQHAEDALLGPFYRWIATIERDAREQHKQISAAGWPAFDDA